MAVKIQTFTCMKNITCIYNQVFFNSYKLLNFVLKIKSTTSENACENKICNLFERQTSVRFTFVDK